MCFLCVFVSVFVTSLKLLLAEKLRMLIFLCLVSSLKGVDKDKVAFLITLRCKSHVMKEIKFYEH